MKLKSIKISQIASKPLLEGLDLSFPERDADYLNANCLIGVNGSGKSQFLETIAEIFIYLDAIYRKGNVMKNTSSPFSFEIAYTITKNDKKYGVNITQKSKSSKSPIIIITEADENIVPFTDKEVDGYLPEKVIGYTSGEN